MSLPAKLLTRDERVVHHLRTHPKILLWNILAALVIVAVVIALSVVAPEAWRPWSILAFVIVAVILLIPVIVMPWLRWLTTTYTITTKRVITRRGIVHKTGHDLPLTRISDVTYERGFTDRLFGCGSLTLQTSADDPLILDDVPDVEQVHVEMTQLLLGDSTNG